MDSAEKSIGTVLEITAPAEDVAVIANLTSIGELGIESDDMDVTDLSSPNGFKEFIGGLKDGGELSFAGITKSEDNVETLNNLADSQDVVSWKITFPRGSTWEVDGYVKSFKEGESTPDGKRTFTGGIRTSGKPVYTPATPSA
jgi:predicted secreted protein